MRISNIEISPVSLALRAPIRTGRSGRTGQTELRERRGARLRLTDELGGVGIGDALPLVSSGTETLAVCGAALAETANALRNREGDCGALLDFCEDRLPAAPATRAAFDCALHLLEAQRQGRAVAELFGASLPQRVQVNAVVGSSELDATLAAVQATLARGFRTLKLKVGELSPAQDQERIAAVRSYLSANGETARLRLDANGAWQPGEALGLLARLAPLGIELVEQPVAAEDLDGLAAVHRGSPIPIAVDESLASEAGRSLTLDGKLGSLAILKPMILGGARSCLRFALAARRHGIRCLVTTTFEGPIGTALATHLAAAIVGARGACGLASSEVMVERFPDALVPENGWLEVQPEPGFGPRLEGGSSA